MTRSESKNESGHALVELSIVAFLLFLIAFWSVELSRVLRIQQMATALSRELASVVYRECLADDAAFPTPRTSATRATQFDPRDCIPDVMNREFLPQLNRIAPTATVTVSYYSVSDEGVTLDYRTPNGHTRFDESAIRADVSGIPSSRSDLGNALVNFGAVIVGEVEIPYTGLGFGGGTFVGFITDRVYGVTIL